MAAFMHPLDLVRQALNRWRSRINERRASTSMSPHELADDARTADIYHKLNSQLWYLPPPD
jgi:uncharacterized protein YjiS (DUF1127 family)